MKSGIPASAAELLIGALMNSPAYFCSAACGIRALMTVVQCAQRLSLIFMKKEDTHTPVYDLLMSI